MPVDTWRCDADQRVLSAAEQEHLFQKAVRIFQHRHAMDAVPPPFNLPIIIAVALGGLKDVTFRLADNMRKLAMDGGDESFVKRLSGGSFRQIRLLQRKLTSKGDLKKKKHKVTSLAPCLLVAEKVCADEYLALTSDKLASSIEGRLEKMREWHEETIAALKAQAERQQQQMEQLLKQVSQSAHDRSPLVKATLMAPRVKASIVST